MERREVTGWALVAAQLVLIVGAAAAPGPASFVVAPSAALALRIVGAGCLLIAILALFGLGRALSASPVPREDGALATTGLHAVVRHPTYALLVVGVGAFAWASGVWSRIGAWMLLTLLLIAKSRWEDAMLAERFASYGDYAQKVPAWLPRLRRR